MTPMIILSTYPNKKIVTKISKKIVQKRFAACVNISKISSIYTWKGKIENTSEYLAIFKTTKKKVKSLKNEIKRTHPYEVPEIAELYVNSVNTPYLKWLVESTT